MSRFLCNRYYRKRRRVILDALDRQKTTIVGSFFTEHYLRRCVICRLEDLALAIPSGRDSIPIITEASLQIVNGSLQ